MKHCTKLCVTWAAALQFCRGGRLVSRRLGALRRARAPCPLEHVLTLRLKAWWRIAYRLYLLQNFTSINWTIPVCNLQRHPSKTPKQYQWSRRIQIWAHAASYKLLTRALRGFTTVRWYFMLYFFSSCKNVSKKAFMEPLSKAWRARTWPYECGKNNSVALHSSLT